MPNIVLPAKSLCVKNNPHHCQNTLLIVHCEADLFFLKKKSIIFIRCAFQRSQLGINLIPSHFWVFFTPFDHVQAQIFPPPRRPLGRSSVWSLSDWCLRSGKFSVVKLVTNKQSKKEYAVKMITKTISDHEEVLKEIEIMRAVDAHPGVVHLIDVYEDDEYFYLVLELYAKFMQLFSPRPKLMDSRFPPSVLLVENYSIRLLSMRTTAKKKLPI